MAEWWKEWEGSSQRTYRNDPWTWTMGWGWTVGAEDRMGQRRAQGENWDNCSKINKSEIKKETDKTKQNKKRHLE